MKKQLSSEIIAVGTELLLGQIANTNAQWISEKLASIGIDVYFHSVVGDNLSRIRDQFLQASKRSDIIIVTGGLGPTDDDLTREAFQTITNMDLVEHKPSMEKIEAYYKRQNRSMTPNNRRQARVFAGADVIENHVGMAPGMIVTHENKTWVFLPGVPKEMKSMITKNVLPYIKHLLGINMVIKSTMLRFIGIGESRLEHELKAIIDQQSNPTIAPLAQKEGVALRLTAKAGTSEEAAQLIEQTQKQILDKVGDFFYGVDEEKIENKVFQMLKAKQWKLAAAESLTGGMFADRIVAISGASTVFAGGVVCYDTKVKENVLHVPSNIIHEKGTVSEECATVMATNVCKGLNADIGISFTGVAGPGTVEGHQAGTVYIGITASNGESLVDKYIFHGDRQTIRQKAVTKGYELLVKFLKS